MGIMNLIVANIQKQYIMQYKVNQKNEHKNRNGKWMVYHDNGELYYIKNYIDGVRVGYKEFHWHTGKISYEYYAR